MKKLFTLFAAGVLFATCAFAQLPTPFQVEPDAVKDFADKNVGSKPQFYFPTRSGEIVVRRVVNPDDPNAIWYQ